MAASGERKSERKTQPRAMPDQEILNIDDAAAFLGVSVKTFAKVLREEDVPGRKVGREWKFSRQALIEWVGHGSSLSELDPSEETPARKRPRRHVMRRRRRVSDGYSVDDL